MPKVLTLASTVKCKHGGRVTTVSSAKLKVSGMSVLLMDSIAGKPIPPPSCPTVPSADASGTVINAPCPAVKEVTSGSSLKLKVGGLPVMLDTLTGTTAGFEAKVTPVLGLTGVPNQVKLSSP